MKSYKKLKRTSKTPDVEKALNKEDVLIDKIQAFTFPELPPLNLPDEEDSVPGREEV